MTPQQEAIATRYLTKVGPKAFNALWAAYGPGAAAETGVAGGAAYGADVAGLSGVGSQGAAQGTAGMTAGSWATVAAPLIMAYLKYQAGSGQNDPLRRRNESLGALRFLSDSLAGQDAKPFQENYGLFNPFRSKSNYNEAPNELDYNANEYQQMNPYDIFFNTIMGSSLSGGKGINSGLTPRQIYGYGSQQGLDFDKLGQQLGGLKFDDWAKQDFDYNSWKTQNQPTIQKAFENWTAPTSQGTYDSNLGQMVATPTAQKSWDTMTPEEQEEARYQEARRLSGM